MFSKRSKYLVGSGFAAIIALMFALLLTGYVQLTRSMDETSDLVHRSNLKTRLLISMYTAVRERSVTVMRVIMTTDPFIRDDAISRFREMGGQYLTAENQLHSLIDTPREIELLQAHKKLTAVAAPVQNQIVDLLTDNRIAEASALVFSKGLITQDGVFKSLEALFNYEEQQTLYALDHARTEYRQTLYLLVVLGGVALIAGIGIAVNVVRRNSRAEDAIFAQVALRSIGDAVITANPEGHINYANRKAQVLIDLFSSDIIGKPIEDVFCCACSLDTQTVDGCSSGPQECELNSKGNSSIAISYTLSPIRNHNGESLGSVLVFRDISEQKRMEQQLRINQDRFSLIMRGTNDGIWDYNLKSGEIYFSPRWKEMLGYREKAFSDCFQQWQEHIHPNDLGLILDVWTECMSGAKSAFSIEYRMKTRSGEWKWVECRGLASLDEMGMPVRLAGSHSDITERKSSEEKLLWHSSHDPLTRLVNRREFEFRLDNILRHIRRSDRECALLYIDLDQFKVINDTCGHVAGDELLRQLSGILSGKVRSTDVLARLGGDEFGVLLSECPIGEARNVAESLRKTIGEHRFSWDNKAFSISCCIGLVSINTTNASRDEVMSAADVACYNAKDLGRNRVHIYQDSDDQLATKHREMRWVSKISKALEENRFVLYQQTIQPVSSSEDEPPHREILIRMLDEKGNVVPPGMFIPAAERYNLMPSVDRWVITTLFSLLAETAQQGKLQIGQISTVNLSGNSLNESGFSNFIKEQFNEFGIDPGSICFEITETSAIENLSQATAFIENLKKLGCLFALDDFGSGLSSFGYLKNLPVDFLKIDGLFVKDMVDDPIDAAMVRSINEIGQVMGMKTIAEFVENDEILRQLADIGVDFAQGYGIAMPEPLADTEKSGHQQAAAGSATAC